MRWVFGMVVLLAAVVGAAWVVPGVLEWGRYRGEIAALASESLGQVVRIDGAVSLVLLPQPMLTAADVTIVQGGGADGASGVSIKAAQLRLQVSLGALLAGHVEARDLVLRGVDMRVRWPLAPGVAELVRPPDWLSPLTARIEDGRLEVGALVFSGINANVTTADDTGSTQAAGTARLSGRDWRFTVRLTRPGGDGSSGLDVTLDGVGPVQGAGATLSGQIQGDGSLVGRVAGRGPDLSQFVPAPAVAFRADGRVNVAGGLFAADELTLDLGGSPARGAVAVRVSPVPRLDVAIAASRLDLDAWLPVLLRLREGEAGSRLPTGIDLSAEAAQLAGGTVRGLRGAFDVVDGALEVREVRAVLPGEAALRVTGRISGAAARFDGNVSLAAPALRTTLAWLQQAGIGDWTRLPAGVLRRADLAGHVVVEAGSVALDGLTGRVDDTKLGGTITVRLGVRPSVVAALTVDRLELDPLMPAELPGLAGIQAAVSGLDAELRIDATQALLRGVVVAPMSLDVATQSGRVVLRRLEGTVQGVRATVSGSVLEGGRIVDGRLDLQAAQTQALSGLLPDGLAFLAHRASGFWWLPATVQVLASGATEALTLKLAADLGDLRIEAQPVLDLRGEKWAGTLTLRHPGAPRLAEALGLTGAPSWLGDGSLALVAQVSGKPGVVAADSFDLTAGALHATGGLAWDRVVSRLSGRVAAETLALPLPYIRAPKPLPFPALVGWQASVRVEVGQVLAGLSPMLQQAAGNVTLADGVMRVEGLSGRLAGGVLAGSISLDVRSSPPALEMEGSVKGAAIAGPLFELPIDLSAGVVDTQISFKATGNSPAALLATLVGDMRLGVRDGQFVGVDLAKATGRLTDEDIRAALAGGSMPFDRLDATAHAERGTLKLGDARLEGPAGSIGFIGGIDLPGASADLRLGLRPAVPDAPEIGLHLNGRFDALRRTPELADVIRWRGERS